MEDNKYWIWLSLLFDYGNDKPNEIMKHYDSPQEFFNASREEMNELGFLTQKDIDAAKTVKLERAEIIIANCEKKKINIVTFGDELYPNRLKLIYGPPMVLYYMGNITGIDEEVAITMVGTRKSTDYSSYATEFLSYSLSCAGAMIISGCAVGIDTCAHIGALKARGRTIAVLACGLDINYPSQNRDLKIMILKNGALITELPPGESVRKGTFQARNRILSGLSLGVVVTHAPERSGALITVEHAIEQGKDVFCLPPYSIFDPQYFGVIKYLRDGATPVFCAKDILLEYYAEYTDKLDVDKVIGDYINQKKLENRPQKIKVKVVPAKAAPPVLTEEELEIALDKFKEKNEKIVSSFDENQLLVYNKLTLQPKFIDELASEEQSAAALSILTEFELLGLVSSFSGRRYSLKCEE